MNKNIILIERVICYESFFFNDKSSSTNIVVNFGYRWSNINNVWLQTNLNGLLFVIKGNKNFGENTEYTRLSWQFKFLNLNIVSIDKNSMVGNFSIGANNKDVRSNHYLLTKGLLSSNSSFSTCEMLCKICRSLDPPSCA